MFHSSNLSIEQKINNGHLTTKFIRTNKTNQGVVDIRGVGRNGVAYVEKVIANNDKIIKRNYVIPEENIYPMIMKNTTSELITNKKNINKLTYETPVKTKSSTTKTKAKKSKSSATKIKATKATKSKSSKTKSKSTKTKSKK